ncbi:hypothetical protein OIU79_011200 [Salix purpurea]|uniref:Uncharacterized protein n=1 Tax=Salix purpurea TaxID=77065 RepID=A0A9Q0QHE4_SALPP|nr:hypothetical protein OIU79_011200 [Salix purpurea]
MEAHHNHQFTHSIFERRPIIKSKAPAVKWFKEWVPQDVVATGGKCSLFKWVAENQLNVLKEKEKEPLAPEPEPEPTTEVLFLCSFEGCGKTFIDAAEILLIDAGMKLALPRLKNRADPLVEVLN